MFRVLQRYLTTVTDEYLVSEESRPEFIRLTVFVMLHFAQSQHFLDVHICMQVMRAGLF